MKNQMTPESFRTGTIAVCRLLLATFLFYPLPAAAQQIIFEAKFDSTYHSEENDAPVVASGLSFAKGVSGQGVVFDSGAILQYTLQDNIKTSEGTLSLWVQPNWDPGEVLYRIMVLGNEPRNFELHVDEGKQLAFSVNTSQIENKPIKVAFASADGWRANTWYFLTFSWSTEKIVIYVNGKKAGEEAVGFDIPATADEVFHLGSLGGGQAFEGIYDELRVYDGSLTPEVVQSLYDEYLDQLPNANNISVIDLFGRDVTSGITLVDWEGPVRNPAMKYSLMGNDALEYPLTVNLSSAEERSSFSLPSTISKNGPTKSMSITAPDELFSFLFSVYMDENGDNETFDLILQYNMDGIPARSIVPVTVIDQDVDRPLSYPVIVDFSEARHPVMLDEAAQTVIKQAAEDWLYYVGGNDIDSIGMGESFLIAGGQDHLFEEKILENPVAYKGYYLFAYGNTNAGPCVCSTGAPNRELLQTRNGEVVPIFRVGGLHLNVFGQAFETEPTGWEVLSPYENWTQEGLIGTDMYTLAKHEIGHAMVFENSPLFLLAQGRDPNNPFPDESIIPVPNGFTSPAITAYYPDTIVPLFPESLSHLYDVIDPSSQSTVYGGAVEEPIMPHGREMLTKLDILIMESVGYPLRDNGVTRSLRLTSDESFDGALNENYNLKLTALGGIPVYYYEIIGGVLPDGLELDSKTGVVTGVPSESGTFDITFQVKDYDERSVGASLEVTIDIAGETTAIDEVSPGNTGGFTLQQNFPNPFSAETIIQFDVPKSSYITLKIYNLLGDEVRTLVQELTPAGTFQVAWNARNERGQKMAGGVYFYRLSDGVAYSQTRKLIMH